MYFQLEDLLHFPAPNYVNPETRGNGLIILNSIFLGIATVFIVLRICSRCFVRKWFGIDDILIILGYISTVCLNALTFDGVINHMWLRHLYDIPFGVAQASLKVAYFSKVLYLICGMFIAFGLLAFYYRLIAGTAPLWFRRTLHVTLAFNIMYFTAMIIAEINICRPVSYYWSFPGPPGAKCFDEGPLTMTKGVIKVFIDLWITTLPIPWVLQTQMKRRQRYLVAILFALGYVVTGAGAARVYYTWKTFFTDGDLSWWLYPTLISSTIENNLAIICACAPTIRPLFPVLFGGPVGRIKGWVSQPRSNRDMSASGDTNDIIRNPARSKSQAALRQVSDDMVSVDSHEDDVELVIQKHGDLSTVSAKQADATYYEGYEIESQHVDPQRVSSRVSEMSGLHQYNHRHSAVSSLHPFDPRLDVSPPPGSWIAPPDLHAAQYGRRHQDET